VQQAFVELPDNVVSGLSYAVVANYYKLGEQNVVISQAQIRYKPLSSNKLRWRAKVGFFILNYLGKCGCRLVFTFHLHAVSSE
jgi:hypothetical protein